MTLSAALPADSPALFTAVTRYADGMVFPARSIDAVGAVWGLVALLAAAPVSAAPILAWGAVTTGSDGLPLDAGLEVTEYRVYQCLTGLGSCTLATATRVAVIPAPATALDLVGKTIPSAYVVTAVNKAGESSGSAALKVMPPDAPKNQRLQ